MKIEVDEKDLVFLLQCADNSADFDEYEKGFVNSANETRKRIRSIVFGVNHQLGFEKYAYDKEFGVEEVKEVQNESK